MKILESGVLRLGHASGMNDFREMQHVHQLIDDYLQRENLPEKLRAMIVHAKRLSSVSKGDVFLACFSEEPDCLSQWRGYADDGAGFNIGFNLLALPTIDKPEPKLRGLVNDDFLFKVSYKESAVMKKLGGLFGDRRNNTKDSSLIDAWIWEMATEITRMSFVYKSPAFNEEKEWRAVYWPERPFKPVDSVDSSSPLSDSVPGKIQFRYSRYGMIPYCTHALKDKGSSIREVLLGPKNPSEIRFVKEFMRHCGYRNVTVRRSAATYR